MPFQLLTQQHERFSEILLELQSEAADLDAGDKSGLRKTAQRVVDLSTAMELHLHVEDEKVLPLIEIVFEGKTSTALHQSQHERIMELLLELQDSLDNPDEKSMPKVVELRKLTRQHFNTEEAGVFQILEDRLGQTELAALHQEFNKEIGDI